MMRISYPSSPLHRPGCVLWCSSVLEMTVSFVIIARFLLMKNDLNFDFLPYKNNFHLVDKYIFPIVLKI